MSTQDPATGWRRAYALALREVQLAPTRYAWMKALKARREYLRAFTATRARSRPRGGAPPSSA